MSRPILRISEAMGRVAAGDYNVELDEEHGAREVREVTRSFNAMVHEL